MKSCYELFGIECGRGWESLYKPLMERAERECVSIHQIKEKFGGLRFYTGPCTDEFHAAIEVACAQSFNICEVCGEPGMLMNDHGWMLTRCQTHAPRK